MNHQKKERAMAKPKAVQLTYIGGITLAIMMLFGCSQKLDPSPILAHLSNEVALSALDDETATSMMGSIDELNSETVTKQKIEMVLVSIREGTEEYLGKYIIDEVGVDPKEKIKVYSLMSILTLTESIADAAGIELTGNKTHYGHKCETNKGPCIKDTRYNCRMLDQWCIQVEPK
jgi:hypothetical protein